ncbi:MAG: aldehyde dehydrogenase family protein, partial [Thermoflavifilum sp.]|nr:aldehyde dehydrogenase family protein [Thermoflavifilum sp.]
PRTSEQVATCIKQAVQLCQLPDAVFQHIHGSSPTVSDMLVKHPCIKAVGFTGSYTAGKALYDIAQQRKQPIPVFAEMGSVNPVFLLPEKLSREADILANMLAASITQNAGQFCTKPGLIFGMKGEALQHFTTRLTEILKTTRTQTMLHDGIAQAFRQKAQVVSGQQHVNTLLAFSDDAGTLEAKPVLTHTTATEFLANPLLREEVFGPFAMIVECADFQEMLEIAFQLEGQLSCTLMATEQDLLHYRELIDAVSLICGRIICNGVPTGVRVCFAMQHGGPFPATTDSRFTSVGADAIKRFTRPVCFQNFPDAFLPAELQQANPLRVWRMVNQYFSQSGIA